MVEQVPPTFFYDVTRNRTSPIWSHPSLKPKHQLEAETSNDGLSNSTPSSPILPSSSLPSSPTLPTRDLGIDSDDEDGDSTMRIPTSLQSSTFEQRMSRFITPVRNFLDGLEYQTQFRDSRMLEVVEREGARLLRLAEDCLAVEARENHNRGERTRTWDSVRANAMYYRSRPRRADVGT
ncbi:hypothetical protein VKT23_009430 [Stygiomarasmius scandens]|uniref:Uncharacterized protein n=1 Tax=Marasmiellus scandens TaxID=2682957 RepID=A0ABR1JGG2_9AGAR